MLYRSPKHRAVLAAKRPRGSVNRAGGAAGGGRSDRLSKAICAALLGGALVGTGREALGASWDPVPGIAGAGDGVVNGGSGTWDLFAPNWTNDGGFTNGPWVNFDAASFGGNTGGLVTVANGGVTASSISFDGTSD